MNRSYLVVTILLVAVSVQVTGASEEYDDVLEEQKMKGNCPEYCSCLRQTGNGAVAQCYRITPTQRFDNLITSFYLHKNRKHSSGEQQLELGDKFFRNMQMKSVDSITIVDVAVKSIDVHAFQGLHSLSQVNLTNNNLATIHPDTFASNENLQRLCLSNNPLSFTQKSRSPYVLNIPDLMELDLSSCQLYNILPTTFSTLYGLVYLNLAANNIKSLDSRVFSNLTEVEEINLSHNNMQTLDTDLFKYNDDLNTLILNNNPLTSVENIQLPGVAILDLSFCRITKLSSKSLAGFVGISNLNLSSNALLSLNVNAFSGMNALTHLDLSNNNFIGQLDESIFLNNHEIATITLRDNPTMRKLPDGGFKGLFEELYKLDVSNCGLETLTPTSFKNMPNLSQLDLSRNTIKSLLPDVLPRKIKHLSLAYNQITSLGDLQFPKEFQLRQLYLQGNQIKHLSPEHFTNLPYLTKLDLSSCGMEKIWSNIDNEDLPYLKKVRKLNLSKNQLLTISPRDLMMFSELTSLDIMSNPLSCNADELQSLITYLNKAHVDPYDMSSSEDTLERFVWEDIWSVNCNRNKNGANRLVDGSSSKNENYDYDYEDGSTDTELDDYDLQSQHELDDDAEHQVPDRHGGVPTKLNISESSYQLIVMVIAASATFASILFLVAILLVCRQRLTHQRDAIRQRRRMRSMSYKPLFDNEHVNNPTTPILKSRVIPIDSEANSNASNEEMGPVDYSQTVGQVTYLSSSFQKSSNGPERV